MSALCGLPRAKALDDLARTIWYGRALVHGLDVPAWEAISLSERHAYLVMAGAVIDAVKPAGPVSSTLFEFAASVARADAARVIGTITPSMPWGVGPESMDQ